MTITSGMLGLTGRRSGLVAALMLGVSTIAAQAETPPRLVKTVVIPDAAQGVERTFFGQISANQTVDLGFQVSGRLMEFDAPEGAVIAKGSVIARLDQRPFKIEVERARLALEQAERTLTRFEKLEGNTVSEARVEDAQTNVDIARVALENAEYALEQTTLVAPFDAVVATRSLANFSTVAAGTQIVRLHDLSELRVDVEVPEVLIQRLGENPNMRLAARLVGSDVEYPLSFREVNAETSQVGQTFRVTLTMQAPQSLLLLPGASVTVTAVFLDQDQGVEIAPSAIATDPEGRTSVFEVTEAGGGLTVTQTPVELSVAPSGKITVLGQLAPGSEIVVGGVNALTDGAPVRRFVADFN